MQSIIQCPGSAVPVLVKPGLRTDYGIQCDDSSVPTLAPYALNGLADLAWSDVNLLIAALLLSCCIAHGFNMLGTFIYNRR